MNERATKILFTVAVVAALSGFVVYSSLGSASYYKMVEEVAPELAKWVDKDLRVHGFVEPGSIQEQIVDQRVTRTFVLESKGERLQVAHHGPKPDTFKEFSEVVAEGRLVHRDGQYVFEANNLMAKCPSKYEGAKQNKNLGAPGAADQPLFAE